MLAIWRQGDRWGERSAGPRWRVPLPSAHDHRPPPGGFADLSTAAAWYDGWLREAALPLWAEVGIDPSTGAFREALTWDGAPH
ncbi:MAG TPA: hypothetical protein VF474_10625, partial [Phenylobacterium sp.]